MPISPKPAGTKNHRDGTQRSHVDDKARADITCLLPMTMDKTDLFSETHYTHSHSAMHSNPHNDELHECPICVFRTLEIPKVPDAYDHVFSTNDPPDDTLLASLRSSLAVIRSLSAEIEKHLATIQHAKDACALSIKKHEAAVHPIRSLPDDILLTIFHWHIHSDTDKWCRSNFDVPYIRLPWSLSQVSHRWRRLSLLSPLLWTAINIRQRNNTLLPNLDAKWSLVIERSADCDLAVTVDNGAYGHNMPSMIGSLLLLSRTTTRWRKLYIRVRHSSLAPLAMCSFERLTDLVWDFTCSDAPTTEFQNTVNLRRLTVLGSAPLDVKWDQITDYTCNPAGFQYLPKLTAMEHLSLDLTPSHDSSRHMLSVRISLPSVLSMSMKQRGNCDQTLGQISQRLHFPSLHTLAIITEYKSFPAFWEPLPNLRHIILISHSSPAKISVFLARHDSVESLHTVSQQALKVLHVIPGQPVILPNLTSLSIGMEALNYYAESIFNIVESRCGDGGGHVARLKELEIVGTERERRQAMTCILEESTLFERWNSVRGKINVVEKEEHAWCTQKC